MSTQVGWVKMHRSMMDSQWYTDFKTNHLFLHCIFKANTEDKIWRNEEIKRGQFITSVARLVDETGLSTKQVRSSLKKLQESQNVANKTTNKYTMITVLNYDEYQDEGKQRANKGQTKGKQRANKGQQLKNNKNKKNNKNIDSDFDFFWDEYGKIGNKNLALKSYKAAIAKKITHEQIMDGVKKYKKHLLDNNTDKKYTKHASTWLNNSCWLDYDEVTAESPKKINIPLHIDPSGYQLWDNTLKALADKIGHTEYMTWFGSVKLVKVDRNLIHASVKSRFVSDWITGKYRQKIIDLLPKGSNNPTDVIFVAEKR